jgi:hypothetical protein
MDQEVRTETVASITECRESLPSELASDAVVFGFDGFVDRVRRMVAERQDEENYDALTTLEELGDRISRSAAADSSLSIEWLETATRTGGHVSHLSRAYGHLGYDPVMLGTFGDPIEEPFVEEFEDHEMVTFGDPGYTDAVEFSDGKLMLMDINKTRQLDWDEIVDTVDPETLAGQIDGTALFGMGYFADMPSFPDIVDGLLEDVWPLLEAPPENVIVDPGDVRKLSETELRDGMDIITRLDDVATLTVTANRFETAVLAETLADAESDPFVETARAAFEALGVSRFVGHGAHESVVVTEAGTSRVAVPRVEDPEITTSSGDHFNVGLSLGLVNEVPDRAAVALGNALASYFVRTGDQPSYDELRSYLDEYEAYLN